jgi:hypothetical protein
MFQMFMLTVNKVSPLPVSTEMAGISLIDDMGYFDTPPFYNCKMVWFF